MAADALDRGSAHWISRTSSLGAHQRMGVHGGVRAWCGGFHRYSADGKSTELLAEKLRTVTERDFLSLVEDGETGLPTAKANLTKTKDEITANDGSSVSYADDQSDNK